ncbi:uncharacterized protein EDB93DRAFT_1109386 [Suillus bovinus]|uniref:uncharacterized protein n=1 Tax=Suillus bovinus TaxID=48563 RepID=UPI001B883220|nr:uncharacterized protein EDB93DRAFT_1109386 [Suillus bovinus]KAG2127175.1 hypothetical protein EDB93DRAFT_1109386 [Suillus bovinus]
MKTYPENFRVSRALQCANTELSIFSHELGEMVSIAYPINRVTRDRILARQLKDWVLRRRVIWECFCALVMEQCTPICVIWCSTPNGHVELFPYFEDYCGTPTNSALVQPQRGGAVRTRRQFSATHKILLQHQIRRPSITLRLPSVADDTHIELASPTSLKEQDVLHSLAEGRGITPYEHIGLLELCGNCQQMFAASALRAHILTCSKD